MDAFGKEGQVEGGGGAGGNDKLGRDDGER